MPGLIFLIVPHPLPEKKYRHRCGCKIQACRSNACLEAPKAQNGKRFFHKTGSLCGKTSLSFALLDRISTGIYRKRRKPG